MALSMYQTSIPAFIRGLHNVSNLLQKTATYATAKKIDPDVLINSRLAPDMFPLVRQVQIATDTVKNAAARLAVIESPAFPDTETNLDELQARLSRAIIFLESITATQLEGSETREVVMKFPGNEIHFTGPDYLLTFVLPNFYFHISMIYAILRHNGVDIGKRDFLGESK